MSIYIYIYIYIYRQLIFNSLKITIKIIAKIIFKNSKERLSLCIIYIKNHDINPHGKIASLNLISQSYAPAAREVSPI